MFTVTSVVKKVQDGVMVVKCTVATIVVSTVLVFVVNIMRINYKITIIVTVTEELQIKISETLAPVEYTRSIEPHGLNLQVVTDLSSIENILYNYRYNELKLDDAVLTAFIRFENSYNDQGINDFIDVEKVIFRKEEIK